MNVVLTQPVEGAAAGDTVDVDDDRARWLLDRGYATLPELADNPGQDRPGFMPEHTGDPQVGPEPPPTGSYPDDAGGPPPPSAPDDEDDAPAGDAEE